jgi:hypothetical protein
MAGSTTAPAFFATYLAVFPPRTVYTPDVPASMMASEEDEEGWFTWQLVPGTLSEAQYRRLEQTYGLQLPASFIDWHRAYYFLDCDCGLLRLPVSNPALPLQALEKEVSWAVATKLIAQKLYPFASEGNDSGPLVFDGRAEVADNEFPIRVYDHEFSGRPEGLSEVIFSSFAKLLECLTHYCREIQTRPRFEVIPEFLQLDPAGAGSTGAAYWLGWAAMEKEMFEEFGD